MAKKGHREILLNKYFFRVHGKKSSEIVHPLKKVQMMCLSAVRP